MNMHLPDSLRVLERGWLSANNIVFLEGEHATLVDSGYVTHAAQTLPQTAYTYGQAMKDRDFLSLSVRRTF